MVFGRIEDYFSDDRITSSDIVMKTFFFPKRSGSRLPYLIFFLSIFSFLPFINKGITVHDEGLIVYAADLVSRGRMLYRDINIPYTPGLFLLLGFLFKLFGSYILIGRSLTVIVGSIINVLIYDIGYRFTRSKVAIVGSILYLVWGASQTNIPWFTLFCLLFAFIQMRIIAGKKPSLFLFSIFSGLIFLFKQNFGILSAVVTMVSVFAFPGNLTPNILLALSGFITGILPGFFYLYRTDAFAGFIQSAILIMLPWARSPSFITPYPLFDFRFTGLFAYLMKKFLYIFPLFIFFLSFVGKTPHSDRKKYLFILLYSLLFFLTGIYPIADILHFTAVLPVSFPLIAVVMDHARRRSGFKTRFLAIAGIVIFYIIGIHKLYLRNYYSFNPPYHAQTSPIIIRGDLLYIDRGQHAFLTAIVPLIQALTHPSEKIFIHHYAPLLYFASNRDISGPYIDSVTGVCLPYQKLANQEKQINYLENDHVRLIVLQGKYPKRPEAENFQPEHDSLLLSYIFSNYPFYAQIDDYQIRFRK